MHFRPIPEAHLLRIRRQLQLRTPTHEGMHRKTVLGSQADHILQIEQSFSLSAASFTISYKDDDGEVTIIANDYDLAEAIQYFQAGDDAPGSSNSSVISWRSGSARKITLRVQVVVDYDGPSLSDTASLASRDDDFAHGSGRRSNRHSWSLSQTDGSDGFSLVSGGQELEDDAVTVSSRDPDVATGPVIPTTSSSGWSHMPPNYRPPSHSVPSVATSPPSPPLSDHAASPAQLSTSQSTTIPWGLAVAPSTRSRSPSAPRSSPGSILSGTIAQSPSARTVLAGEQSTAPTDVFERLRLADQAGSSGSAASSNNSIAPRKPHNDRGVQWLQEQNARTMHNMIGAPPPSSSSDASSLMLLEPEAEDGIKGGLALEQNMHGRFYYSYTSDSGSQQGGSNNRQNNRYSMSSDLLTSPIDRRISTTSQNLRWLASQQSKRLSGNGSQLSGNDPMSRSPGRSATSTPVAPVSSSYNRPLPELPEDAASVSLEDFDLSTVPKELLPFLTSDESHPAIPPTEVTDCSSCESILDTFRYVCHVCGPKKVMPRSYYDDREAKRLQEHYDALDSEYDPKGKGRAIDLTTAARMELDGQQVVYPPPRSDSLRKPLPPVNTNNPFTEPPVPGATETEVTPMVSPSPLSALSSLWSRKTRGFKKMDSKPAMKPTSSTGSAGSSIPMGLATSALNLGSQLSLPETASTLSPRSSTASPTSPLSPRHPHARQSSRSISFESGFELCSSCVYTAGVSHAYEGALDLNQGHSQTHSSLSSSAETLVSGISSGSHACSVSPLSSPDEADSVLRRLAPAQKGRTRHAFVESVWDGSEGSWKVIGEH